MRPRRSAGGWGLYALSLVVELGPALVRYLLVGVPAYLALRLDGEADPRANAAAVTLGAVVALAPLAWSLLGFLGLSGGALDRFRLGARPPSGREREQLDDALQQLGDDAPAPWRLYVVDASTLDAFVIGQAVFLHRPLVWDPALPAVLAHELSHARSIDGRLTLALRRLTLLTRRSGLIGGGVSLWLLHPLWEVLWRRREFSADAFAARLGQGSELAAYLERHQLFDVAVPFLAKRPHPYAEQRIERLLWAAQRYETHGSRRATSAAEGIGADTRVEAA